MNVKISGEVTIDTEVFIENDIIKSHNCELGEWYGSDICYVVDINELITNAGLPKGEYKMTIKLEKI